MRYSTADAQFSIKEIDIGMAADVGTLQRLPRIIGDGMMRELAYTGRMVDGEEARSIGLVNRTYADQAALMDGVFELARQIAAKSPIAIRGTKEMIRYDARPPGRRRPRVRRYLERRHAPVRRPAGGDGRAYGQAEAGIR